MKNLFEISFEERNRILEMHINASKRQYLTEQKRSLKINVTNEIGEKLPFVTIIDMGDRTNGVVTDDNGFATLNNFVGPEVSVNFVGMETQTITPEVNKDTIDVILKPSGSLKTLEIKVKQFQIKIVDSVTGVPIPNCEILTKNKSGEDVVLKTNEEGIAKFDSSYDFNITIKKEGYVEKQYKIDDKFKESGLSDILGILIDKIVEVPSELEYLIGKTYIFEDKNLKEPKTYKITNAQYINNDDYTTVELSVSEEGLSEMTYIIFECKRVIFQSFQKNEKGRRTISKNYFYQRDLSNYLLNKTKCCNKIDNK